MIHVNFDIISDPRYHSYFHSGFIVKTLKYAVMKKNKNLSSNVEPDTLIKNKETM